MSIREAFLKVILDLMRARLDRAKIAPDPVSFEFYINDVVQLNLLARAMAKADDPTDPIETVPDGLRTLVVEELIAAGLVTDDGED